MVRLKKELNTKLSCLNDEMDSLQNNFEYETWTMLSELNSSSNSGNSDEKLLLKKLTDVQLELSSSKVDYSNLVLSLDNTKQEIEKAQNSLKKATKELETCNLELTNLYEKEALYSTAKNNDNNKTRLNLLKRQIQIKEALRKNATENLMNAQTFLERKEQEHKNTEQNLEDALLEIKKQEDIYGKINEKLIKSSHIVSTETSITKAGNGT